MPGRHIVKQFGADNYYHVYNRGVAKQDIFRDQDDYAVFLNLFKRHLSDEPFTDQYGRSAVKLNNDIELLSFCLLPNHFHLLVYNISDMGLPDLMRRTMTAYSMYFNKRYKRVGSLFQDTYKASLIIDEAYLLHISRYIHLNPQDINEDFEKYPYSSYQYFLGKMSATWLHPQKIMDMHENNPQKYREFVKDYEAFRKDLQLIKSQLADR